jgi:hypothetical protein
MRSTRQLPLEKSSAVRSLVIACLLAFARPLHAGDAPSAADATAAAPAAPHAGDAPLDIREAPFANGDWNWLDGQNRQPNPLLTIGPVTFSMVVDVYYGFQFAQPTDHTIFPGTTATRHDEIGLNLVTFGAEVTGLDGPIGRFVLQAGDNVETDAGQDSTGNRGFYLSQRALAPIQQAAAGWHFHIQHGLNIEAGLLLSYVGLESYIPEENWNYTHSFLSDFTPYYFTGIRTQLYPTQDLKLELWIVNGWQTFGEWHETKALGELIQWRPSERITLTHDFYLGHEERFDPHALRIYSDNSAQFRYLHNAGFIDSAAVALVGDLGFEHRALSASGWMGGASITNRLEAGKFALTLRGDLFADQTQALIQQLPTNSSVTTPLPDRGAFLGGGFTATLDFWPSPWVVCRLEYSHRAANIPYFSGPGGITPPSSGADASNFVPDLRRSDDRVVANVTLRL